MIHDNILPSPKSHDATVLKCKKSLVEAKQATASDIRRLEEGAKSPSGSKITRGIDKNQILEGYSNACLARGVSQDANQPTGKPTNCKANYPTNSELVRRCRMKPSLNHQYRVSDLNLGNVIVIVMKSDPTFLSRDCISSISAVNKIYNEMVNDVMRLRKMDFSSLTQPRLDYVSQMSISKHRIDLATAGMIHYSLHPGMLVRFMNGEYTGENRDVKKIMASITPYVSDDDARHAKRILTQGCPSMLVLEESNEMKNRIIEKGNQQTFAMYPELVTTTMNKEERHSHLIALKRWVLHFSPYCRSTAQGIQIKPNKDPRIIWDGSTKDSADLVVLNEVTPTEFEAVIDFGKAKAKLLTSIYNWRISFPTSTIYIALADITACFRFARIMADITGAFGFMADDLYFLSTSHVFGSNTSASSWEPLRRSIQALIPVKMRDENLVGKHRELLDAITWDEPSGVPIVQATACEINTGVLTPSGEIEEPKGNIYVDDILSAGVARKYIENLMAATFEAIFEVCGQPKIEVRQCPLSLKKWWETIIGPRQTVLGLMVDTNAMTVGLPKQYRDKVRGLLEKWPKERRFFRCPDMQKLIGKIARLGEGAPWIFKIMSHLYTSLAFALQSNKAFLEASSPKFKALVNQIHKKQFSGDASDIAKQMSFAMKTTAKMVNSNKSFYPINESMREELNFIRQALSEDSGIKFKTPIAFLIPRMPTGLAFGDSSLTGCGGYSTKFKFWWHLAFPEKVLERTLLMIKSKNDPTLISINALEYVTVIINYCASLVALNENPSICNDQYPIVLCVTDNTSAKNWTMHTSKTSPIGRALARIFCGILINSNLGINAKWIDTHANIIADDISRVKESTNNPSSPILEYDFSQLQQKHSELKTCRFFQLSPKLLSAIWNILLTRKCPELKEVLALKLCDFGKLLT